MSDETKLIAAHRMLCDYMGPDECWIEPGQDYVLETWGLNQPFAYCRKHYEELTTSVPEPPAALKRD